ERVLGGLWGGWGLGRPALPSRRISDRARPLCGARDPGRHREPLPDELLGGRGAPAARLPGSGIRGRRIVSATSPRTHRAGGRVVHVPVWCEDWRASKFNLLTHNLSKLFRRPTGLAGARLEHVER